MCRSSALRERSPFRTGLAKEVLLQMRAKTMAQESRGWSNRNILIEILAESDQEEDRAERETCRNAALLATKSIETVESE